MIARCSLLLLIATGPTPGLSIGALQVKVGREVEVKAVVVNAVGVKAVEVTASGSTLLTDDQMIRRGDEDPDEDPDEVDAASVNVDTTSLCGQSCKDVIAAGAPCDAFYGSGCKGAAPPGFRVESTLYELCPFACGPKPEEQVTSWVWLYCLLGLCVPLVFFALLAGIVRICSPKMYEIWAGRARQVQKSLGARYEAWKYGSNFEYEEWEDEDWEEEYEEEDMATQSMNADGASQSVLDDEGASKTNVMDGASQSKMDDAGASQSMGSNVMGQATAMMEQATAMMGSSMFGEQATTTMATTTMGTTETDEQATTIMGTTEMGSGEAPEQPTMQNIGSTDSL